MDLALRAALVTAVLARLGGTRDDAFDAVDEIVGRIGEPTDDAGLRRFMRELDAYVASLF